MKVENNFTVPNQNCDHGDMLHLKRRPVRSPLVMRFSTTYFQEIIGSNERITSEPIKLLERLFNKPCIFWEATSPAWCQGRVHKSCPQTEWSSTLERWTSFVCTRVFAMISLQLESSVKRLPLHLCQKAFCRWKKYSTEAQIKLTVQFFSDHHNYVTLMP